MNKFKFLDKITIKLEALNLILEKVMENVFQLLICKENLTVQFLVSVVRQ